MQQQGVWRGRRQSYGAAAVWNTDALFAAVKRVFGGNDDDDDGELVGRCDTRRRLSSFLRAKRFLTAGQHALYRRERILDFTCDLLRVVCGFCHQGDAYSIVGVFVSSKRFVFRVTDYSTGAVYVRHMRWFPNSGKIVSCGVFTREGEWLLCGCRDGSVCVIPIHGLITGPIFRKGDEGSESYDQTRFGAVKGNAHRVGEGEDSFGVDGDSAGNSQVFGHLDDITSVCSVAGVPVQMVMWRCVAFGRDYCIVGTNSGHVFIVSPYSRDKEYTFKLKAPVLSMHVASDEGKQVSCTFVFVSTTMGCFKILLERIFCSMLGKTRRNSLAYETVFRNNSEVLFSPVKLIANDSDDNYICSLQNLKGNSVIGIQGGKRDKLVLYSVEGEDLNYPLYVYSVPKNLGFVHVSDPLIIACIGGKNSTSESAAGGDVARKSKVAVLSRLQCSTSLEQVACLSVKETGEEDNESTLQEFEFSNGESIIELAYNVCLRKRVRSKALEISFTSSNFEMDDKASSEWNEKEDISIQSDNTLQPFVAITNFGIYEFQPCFSPEELFLGMLSSNMALLDRRAEIFGKSLGLDLLSLYEYAADNVLLDLEYYLLNAVKSCNGCYRPLLCNSDVLDSTNSMIMRALHIYHLSNVNTGKLILKFVHLKRLDVVINYLLVLVKDPEGIERTKMQLLSDILFASLLFETISKCSYKDLLHREVHSRSKYDIVEALSNDSVLALEAFIVENRFYNCSRALKLLLHFNLQTHALLAAHCRDDISTAMSLLFATSLASLTPKSKDFLIRYRYLDFLCLYQDGIFLEGFSRSDVLNYFLDEVSFNSCRLPYIERLIQFSNHVNELESVAFFFCPEGDAFMSRVNEDLKFSLCLDIFVLSCARVITLTNKESIFWDCSPALKKEINVDVPLPSLTPCNPLLLQAFINALDGKFGAFDKAKLMNACMAGKLWNVCAEILESQNCLGDAVRMRFNVLNLLKSDEKDARDQYFLVICRHYFKDCLKKYSKMESFDIVCEVFSCAARLEISLNMVEDCFCSHIESLAFVLNIFLLHDQGNSEMSKMQSIARENVLTHCSQV